MLIVSNTGAGIITIDAGASLIDGVATMALAAGEKTMIRCDGSTYRTLSSGGGGGGGGAGASLGKLYSIPQPIPFL
jgi:hypothetical protein